MNPRDVKIIILALLGFCDDLVIFKKLLTTKINFIQKIGFNSIFWLTLLIMFTMIIDNSISSLPLFTSGKNSILYRTVVFCGIVSISVFTQLMFLKTLGKLHFEEMVYKSKIRFIRNIVPINQYVLIAILIFSMLQVIFSYGYSRDLILITTWLSVGLASFQMAILTSRLISWLRNNMDYMVLAYSFTTCAIFVNLLFMLIYITYEVNDDPVFIGSTRNSLVSFTSNTSMFSQGYSISSIASFIFVWVSSALLLRHYSKKIGRLKLWIILAIPLVYFVAQFQYQILEYLYEVRISYPVVFNIVYTFIINASKPIGGILAGVALWGVARKIEQANVRNYLILAAYGVMILLSSTQAIRILSSPYPPFGITTITFMSLGSYSMLLGLYFSAIYVSQDTKLRQTISRSSDLSEQTKFLKNIRRSQMESEIQKNVRLMIKKYLLDLNKKVEYRLTGKRTLTIILICC
jgi:hypothetical protein